MEFKKFVKIRREKFGAVIFDTLREKVFVTNVTGAKILGFLEDKIPTEDIPLILAERFRSDASLIQKDMVDFIRSLEEKDLVIKYGINSQTD